MNARNTTISINYKGKDISEDIATWLTSFTFTDNSGGTADDISFSLLDREALWIDSWFPAKGDKVTCSIVKEDGVTQSLPCGQYEVDQIDYSAPPRLITIKAVSAAVTKGIKSEKHSKAWENVSLSAIASDIANDNGLSLYYDGGDIQLKRREQIRMSDLDFISELCREYDLDVKVNEGKLIIVEGSKQEEQESVAEINLDEINILSYKFSTKAAQIYKKAKVKYHHAADNTTYEGEYEDDSVEGTERVLELNDYAESDGDAKAQATKRLKEANRREVTGTLTLVGDIRFRAGVNVTISGFGAFSGKYLITKATHKVGDGYTTTLELKQGSAAKKSSKQRKGKKQQSTLQYYEGDNYYGNERV